jgi:TonB family protein
MDYSPRSTPSDPGIPHAALLPGTFGLNPSVSRNAAEYRAQAEVLRRDLDTGARSVESILRAATDAARVLSGAAGTALALRTNGVIVCRARSGTTAPELGAPLDVTSGISGECLRTASILVCNDSATDSRVDTEVCVALGIRSIVVVPVHGAAGMIGILEAFSTHRNAFGPEQIDSLRALAEIAEAAYARGAGSPSRTHTPISARPALFAPPVVVDRILDVERSGDRHSRRRYWIFGAAAVVLLLVSMVVWLSWREPASEVAASETPAHPVSAPEGASRSLSLQVVPLKPQPGIAARPSDRLRMKDMLRNAADIQPASDRPLGDHNPGTPPASGPDDKTDSSEPSSAASEPLPTLPPPTVEVAASTIPAELAGLSMAPDTLPTLGAAVSQGVSEGTLIHKVDPTYPPEGLVQRLAGAVILEATIAEDGSVSKVTTVSGPPVLASAAAAAVSHWRYSPWKLSGKPVEVQKQITIVFKLP